MPSMTRQTANLILYRQRAGLEVFLVTRSIELNFLGGYLAFAGGKVEPGDESIPLADGLDTEAPELLGCAVRELFEETGILALRGATAAGDELKKNHDTAPRACLQSRGRSRNRRPSSCRSPTRGSWSR